MKCQTEWLIWFHCTIQCIPGIHFKMCALTSERCICSLWLFVNVRQCGGEWEYGAVGAVQCSELDFDWSSISQFWVSQQQQQQQHRQPSPYSNFISQMTLKYISHAEQNSIDRNGINQASNNRYVENNGFTEKGAKMRFRLTTKWMRFVRYWKSTLSSNSKHVHTCLLMV